MDQAEFDLCECSAHYRREQGEPDAPHAPGCPADDGESHSLKNSSVKDTYASTNPKENNHV